MEFDKNIYFPPQPDASTLVIACEPKDYLASAICRAVEDCDAHVLNLNVLGGRTEYGAVEVALRIDRRNASAVARSLRRFGYDVVETDAHSQADPGVDHARDRVNELLRYLEV